MNLSALSADVPQPRVIVELGTLDFRAQLEHGPQRELVHDKLQVVLRLLPARIAFAPGPFLKHFFREGQAVVVGLTVSGRAGILVPSPGAPHVAGAIKHFHVEACFSKVVAQRNTGETGAHGDHVIIGGMRRTHNFLLLAATPARRLILQYTHGLCGRFTAFFLSLGSCLEPV